jgi:hypothetical protein
MTIGLLADRDAPQPRFALLEETARLLREWGADADILVPGPGPVRPRHELHVVACEGEPALEMANALAAAGAVLLDSYPAVRSAHDRAGTLRKLATAGVPVLPGGLWRPTHTLDGLGGQVFGVVHAARALSRDAAVTLAPELRAIAVRCGEALHLSLFAVDLVVRRGEAGVVGVRPFPSLGGVPDAALRLADFVYDSAAQLAESATGSAPHP